MFYWIAYYIIKLFSLIFFPFSVRGREHVPASGGYILASNHLSNLDPFLIGLSLDRPISYVAKDSLFKNPVAAFFWKKVNAFPIRRGTSDIRSLRESMRRLKHGMPLVVFPEGTRKALREEEQEHRGIGFMVAKCGVPVVPVKIEDSDKVLPPRSRWFRSRHPIRLTFGEPLNFTSEDSYEAIVARVMKIIRGL